MPMTPSAAACLTACAEIEGIFEPVAIWGVCSCTTPSDIYPVTALWSIAGSGVARSAG